MPVRKVGSGPAKVSKVYKPLKMHPETFEPVRVYPNEVRPSTPVLKDKPRKTPASVPSSMKPPPPTKLPPQKWVPAPVPKTPAKTATKSSSVPSPITQPPPTPGPSAGPPTWNRLKSPRSVPTLLNGHAGGKPGGILVASKSNPALNSHTLESPQPGPDPFSATLTSTSTSSMNVPGLRSEQTPRPSSLLDNKLAQPSPVNISPATTVAHNPLPVEQKTAKQGFFARLFGFGRSQSKDSKEPRPTKRLSKLPTTRPMSVPLVNYTTRLTPGPTTRRFSIATLDSTQPPSTATLDFNTQPTIVAASNITAEKTSRVQRDTLFGSASPRQRAVLVKKPPIVQPTKHSRQSSPFTHPSGLPSHQQNPSHITYDSYPHGTIDLENLTPEPTTIVSATDSTIPPNVSNFKNHNHEIAVTNPTHTVGQTHGDPNHSYDINHIQPVATTDHTQHVGTGKYYGQSTSYTYGGYSGAQNSGYQSLATTSSYALCVVCNANPQYVYPTTGKSSPYCSDVCNPAATTATPQTQRAICSYQGCTYPAVMYPKDHYWNYCSESHERLARKGCINCRQPAGNGKQLCKGCNETFKYHNPTIIPVPMDHDAFWNVVDRFTESWGHSTRCPVVRAVYKVALTQHNLDTYLGYRDTLEYYGCFTTQGKLKGNERILWHGTRRGCNLGEAGQTTPCMIPRCSLCSIIRGSFDIGEVAANTPAGRFGIGIYTSTKTSKASDYSGNDKGVVSPLKALLLNDVAVGREYMMRYDDRSIKAPPQGYNSVYGEVGGGSDYDELVVYTNYAIRPTWLVMYNGA